MNVIKIRNVDRKLFHVLCITETITGLDILYIFVNYIYILRVFSIFLVNTQRSTVY